MRKRLTTALAALALLAPAGAGIALAKQSLPKELESYAFKRGLEAYQEGDFSTADSWFDQELQANPKNGYAYFYKAIMNAESDQPGQALSYLDKSIKLIPKKQKEWQAATYCNRANVYLVLADTVSAYKDLAMAIKNDPGDRDFYIKRGNLYYEQGRTDEADADYRKILELDPNDTFAILAIGRSACDRGDFEEAEKLFTRAIKLQPDYASAYRMHATVMQNYKWWNEMADDIIKALENEDSSTTLKYISDAYPEEGVPVLKLKLKIQASKDPQNIIWPFASAVLAEGQKDYLEAIEYYKKVDEINPNFGIDKKIGAVYFRAGRYNDALRHYNKAVNMDPDDISILGGRANVLENMGRFKDAIDDRNEVVDAYPDSEMVYVSRAYTFLKSGDYKKAVEDLETVAMLRPSVMELTSFLVAFGDAYRLAERDTKAEQQYKKAVEIAEKKGKPDGYVPLAYASLLHPEKAVAAMENVLANDSTDRDGNLYQQTCMYVRLGRNEAALASLKKAIEAGYDNPGHLMTDYDLAPIRGTKEFREIMNTGFPDYILESDNTARGVVTGEQPVGSVSVVSYSSSAPKVSEVPFTRESGVTKVKCSINDLPLYFVFDTGASDVTISQVEATFMLKNDYIKPSDVIGSSYYVDANGDVNAGTVINLKKVKFGELELDNVRASVVRNQRAPLLLGQSVLGRLGKIEIDNPGQKIIITENR